MLHSKCIPSPNAFRWPPNAYGALPKCIWLRPYHLGTRCIRLVTYNNNETALLISFYVCLSSLLGVWPSQRFSFRFLPSSPPFFFATRTPTPLASSKPTAAQPQPTALTSLTAAASKRVSDNRKEH
jgi:hypothetical protein